MGSSGSSTEFTNVPSISSPSAPGTDGSGLDLTPLLSPRSVAVVGANDRPGSYADTVLRNLERARFAGPVWGVHPERRTVHGRPCVPSLLDLPDPVDAVVVAIPAARVAPVIAAAGQRGCGGAIVLAAGFGEVEDGQALELELAAVAAEARLPICGPNGNGIVSVGSRAPLWGDSVPPLRPGRVAMVSQSGNIAVNAIGSSRGIDFHTLISTGNQAVVSAGDWLEALAAADGVGSVALFLEDDGDGERLATSLARCAEARVGVAVLKVGLVAGRRPGRRRAYRGTRRGPARLPGADRGCRGRLGVGPARAARARAGARRAARPAPQRRRPRGAHLLGRRLGARRRRGRAHRRRAAGAGAGDRRCADRAAPGRGDDRQPARLHVADLGRRRSPAPDRGDGRLRSRDRPAGALLRPPGRARAGARA